MATLKQVRPLISPLPGICSPFLRDCLPCRGRTFPHSIEFSGGGYALKAGQLTYDCRYSTMHGMPVTGGRGFRGLKLLWYNGVPPGALGDSYGLQVTSL